MKKILKVKTYHYFEKKSVAFVAIHLEKQESDFW